MFNLNKKIYSNNNNLLFGVINDLQQINNITKDNLVIKRIGDIIIKMNFIINENKKNNQLIIKQASLLQNQNSLLQNQMNLMNKKLDELKFNNINQINNKEIKYKNGKYIGQVVNGKAEGKGIRYYNDGDRYEGDFKNDKPEGKGIYYFNNADRMMGDYYNGNQIGKHAMLTKNGEVKTLNF